MNELTIKAIREWVAKDGGNIERTARWMSRALRIGSVQDCRAFVAEAMIDKAKANV